MASLISNSPEETIELGRRIGSQLRGGEVISLIGDLGAGKTHLVKGIALGIGADGCEQATSPTFVLVNEYFGRLEMFHIDAYRLERQQDFVMLGFDDFCHPGAVVVVEWANKVESVLRNLNCIEINLKHAGESIREIEITNTPEYVAL